MPTYAYACTECDHRFDAVQSFSDAALTDCPQCSGRLRKLFSAVGIVFKGSGFYRTDSRAQSNGTNGSKAKSSANGSTDSGSTDSGSRDSGSRDSGSRDNGSSAKSESKEPAAASSSKSASNSSSSNTATT
ncbi:MAG TPA: FmdB family zinc ribbon protein [Pseudonocardiaceae bacterium]|nr:FmdB family zinc ribbon protein [Pseudonocardiaceae bacterium]